MHWSAYCRIDAYTSITHRVHVFVRSSPFLLYQHHLLHQGGLVMAIPLVKVIIVATIAYAFRVILMPDNIRVPTTTDVRQYLLQFKKELYEVGLYKKFTKLFT